MTPNDSWLRFFHTFAPLILHHLLNGRLHLSLLTFLFIRYYTPHTAFDIPIVSNYCIP